MTKVLLKGVHPALDGAYEFDPESGWTNFELHAIKRATGLAAGELEDAYARHDNDVVVALAMVVLLRDGKMNGQTPWSSEQMQALWKAPLGAITTEDEEPEGDARPPDLTAEPSGSAPSSGGVSAPA